jgi:hypothetical protein
MRERFERIGLDGHDLDAFRHFAIGQHNRFCPDFGLDFLECFSSSWCDESSGSHCGFLPSKIQLGSIPLAMMPSFLQMSKV